MSSLDLSSTQFKRQWASACASVLKVAKNTRQRISRLYGVLTFFPTWQIISICPPYMLVVFRSRRKKSDPLSFVQLLRYKISCPTRCLSRQPIKGSFRSHIYIYAAGASYLSSSHERNHRNLTQTSFPLRPLPLLVFFVG